jgi:hypothetical protein
MLDTTISSKILRTNEQGGYNSLFFIRNSTLKVGSYWVYIFYTEYNDGFLRIEYNPTVGSRSRVTWYRMDPESLMTCLPGPIETSPGT